MATLPSLIIAGITLPAEAFPASQDYAPLGGSTVHRKLNGAAAKQTHWTKLATTLSGSGWSPLALAGVDWSVPVSIACIAPRAIRSATVNATLPAARRADFADAVLARAIVAGRLINTPVSVLVNAATATAVSGATGYEFLYYPLLDFVSQGPREALDMGGAAYGWSLEAEEV